MDPRAGAASQQDYRSRAIRETLRFQDQALGTMHDLPPIFHHWSNTYIKPRLQTLGVADAGAMFKQYLLRQCEAHKDGLRFVSLGSGNCELELEIALHLQACGHTNFVIDCLDLNPAMLERGNAAAVENGVQHAMQFVPADLNEWIAGHEYDAAIANQSLHHVVKLEHLFEQIRQSLKTGGCFVISDIIGRNGHLRWPEALGMVREFWTRLPPSYRFNRQLQRYEEMFQDWDCSTEAFEGIRAQEILPLLLDRFHFHFFFGFANLIEPFVDRAFGYNFDASSEWDRNFIGQVHRRDEEEMLRGCLKPTHMFAVVAKTPGPLLFQEPFTPQFCLRDPSVSIHAAPAPQNPYLWDAWPHDRQAEVGKLAGLLAGAEGRVTKLNADLSESTEVVTRFRDELDRVDRLLQERTAWALELDRQIGEQREEIARLNRLAQERTEWALNLDGEIERLTTRIERLNSELAEQTGWALRLDREVQETQTTVHRLDEELENRTRWALELDGELGRLGWARRLDWYYRSIRSRIGRLFRRSQSL